MLSVLSLGMGSHPGDTDTLLTIEALYAFCDLPGECGVPATWEGKTVTVAGRIDPANIFDREHYPQLPYEKFRLMDGKGRSVEIWPQAGDNRAIFNKIAMRSSDEVTITGQLVAVEMPISNRCQLGVKVVVDHADHVQFK